MTLYEMCEWCGRQENTEVMSYMGEKVTCPGCETGTRYFRGNVSCPATLLSARGYIVGSFSEAPIETIERAIAKAEGRAE